MTENSGVLIKKIPDTLILEKPYLKEYLGVIFHTQLLAYLERVKKQESISSGLSEGYYLYFFAGVTLHLMVDTTFITCLENRDGLQKSSRTAVGRAVLKLLGV